MKIKVLSGLILAVLVTAFGTLARAQNFSVVHTFTGGRDGLWPMAGVTVKGGNLYGTTYLGPLSVNGGGWGTVYQVRPLGSTWATDTLHLFIENTGDGAIPDARVAFGPDGLLYGTTLYGGSNNDTGTIFRLTPSSELCRTANCFWKEEIVHSFNGSDGMFPASDLIWDQQANIYSTTDAAGYNQGYQGNVFQLMPSGNSFNLSTLYLFHQAPSDGQVPYGGVTFDKDGNVWGPTNFGGAYNVGIIYELKNVQGVGWQENIVHQFTPATDGGWPLGTLVQDAAGNFYGTTSDSGVGGGGNVFELSPSGDSWTFQVIHDFAGAPQNQCGPCAGVTMDAAGNLYGTTRCNGAHGAGNVFKLTKTQNGWVYDSLYDFTNGSDGADPISVVTIDTDGTLYGTASQGGSFAGLCQNYMGCGTVWMIKP